MRLYRGNTRYVISFEIVCLSVEFTNRPCLWGLVCNMFYDSDDVLCMHFHGLIRVKTRCFQLDNFGHASSIFSSYIFFVKKKKYSISLREEPSV